MAISGVVAFSSLMIFPALADLPRRSFGPGIDPFPTYQGQRTCSPSPKPGVVGFKRVVHKAFPGTGEGYISRSCSVGGQSEHKEGRAWDWTSLNASSDADRRKVGKVLNWLLNRDEYGSRYARARRFGVMYIIWNRRIWTSWYGWRSYTGSSPHTDHVHFSFTWPGARKQTSYWRAPRTFVLATEAHPKAQGYWASTGNGTVLRSGASDFFGDKRNSFTTGKIVSMAATPSGKGYWLIKRGGTLLTYGDAAHKGTVRGDAVVADMTAMSRGSGYWIVTRRGRVVAFGNAERHGSVRQDVIASGIARTPRGGGYWVATRDGRVFNFGGAKDLEDLSEFKFTVVDIASSPEQGYWLVTPRGKVFAFGGAQFFGDKRGKDLAMPITGIVPTPNGEGYWLINRKGKAHAFGNASDLGISSPATAPPEEPRNPNLVPEAYETLSFLRRVHRAN
ncbi:MAG: hypothetical protein M3280_01630 [Actinomycetota bacterium]|nr:hypothetical protein [Actinomycetota bacterium]